MRPVERQRNLHSRNKYLILSAVFGVKSTVKFQEHSTRARNTRSGVSTSTCFGKIQGADPLLNDATFLLKASNDSCYQEQSIWTAAGLAHKFED